MNTEFKKDLFVNYDNYLKIDIGSEVKITTSEFGKIARAVEVISQIMEPKLLLVKESKKEKEVKK